MVEIIGEIGTNHNGSFKTAIKLIDLAKETNIESVKFQVYDNFDIVSPLVKTEFYNINSEYKYWKDFINNKLITPKDWLKDLVTYSKEKELGVIATPHSIKNAEFCLNAGVQKLKIASMDCNYNSFLKDLSTLNIPLLLSTGMANKEEIIKSVETIKKNCDDLTLFHCVSTYPTKYEEVNLKFFEFLKTINNKIALSDHSQKNDIAMMSLVYDIVAVEKHITLDKNQNGPDHPFALDREGLIDLRNSIDNGLKALGSIDKKMSKKELKNRLLYRRVAIATRDIEVNEKLQKSDYTFARPDNIYEDVLSYENIAIFEGFEIKNNIKKGQAIRIGFFK